jgi:hypothetical protein
MNRRDLLRLGGGFLMNNFFSVVGPEDLAAGGRKPDRDPDLWEEDGIRALETFVGRGKYAEHIGPSLLHEPPGVRNLHDLRVMAKSDFNPVEFLDSLVRDNLGLNPRNFDWRRQLAAIAPTVGRHAGIGYPTLNDFHSFCLCLVWPGGLFRWMEDPRLKVSRRVDQPIKYLDADSPEIHLGPLGTVPIKDILWGHPSVDDPEKAKKLPIARIKVHRTMTSPLQWEHIEYIYCRADPMVDLVALLDTRSPGEFAIDKVRTDGLRATAIFGHHWARRLAHDKADAPYSSFDIELDPRNAWVLSIRAAKASFGSMLIRMPVELRGLTNILQGKSTP